ncbi:MAG: hypothetical protein IAG10_25370 [Planctomycetaceae bacterium]|nr:hypothetical protein [Planctomycetaceae bacterium]
MIAQFALRLICGMSLMWALMPRRQVTSGFFRIQMLVVMGLGVLITLTVRQHDWFEDTLTPAFPPIIALLGFLGSVLWTLERRSGGEWIGFALCAVSVGALLLSNITFEDMSRPVVWLTPLSQLAGSGVLGGTVVGMLLGHWYLTAPTMSIDPLKRINLFLGVAGVLRFVVSAAVVLLLWGGAFDPGETSSRLAAVPKAWFGLRWLAGVIGPIVVSVMVWRILKYRNTQAATGVLFVGVILAFIGDMTAALLLSETKLPL